MPPGRSNRIVIDVDDVALKRRMYSALAEDGLALKEWFVAAALDYLASRRRHAASTSCVAEPSASCGELETDAQGAFTEPTTALGGTGPGR
jgi:hypothetical protein